MIAKVILVVVTLTSFTDVAFGENDAMKKYRNYKPEQIKAMSEEVRRKELPMTYIWAAQRGLASDSELLFGMQLNQLMYSGIHDFKSAVLSFQKDLGDPANGVLTVWQIHQLEHRVRYQKLRRVLFPSSFVSNKNGTYGQVKGTLTILDDQAAWPINQQRIVCLKSEKSCEVSQVMLDVPKPDSWSQSYQVMVDSTEYYNITGWTKDTIEAQYPSKPDSCRTTSLSLNFKTKEFFFITKNAGGKCEILGKSIEKLAKPRISQIVDGEKIFDEEFRKIEKTAHEMLAGDFRKKVDAAVAQSKRK